MALQTIGAAGSSGGISASYLNQLIQVAMSMHRRPLETMKAERDSLEIRKAVFTDLNTILGGLRGDAQKLLSSSSASASSVFGQKVATSSDTNVLTVSASTFAAAGTYSLTVDRLAQAHQVYSKQLSHADQALNWSGTIYLGGGAQRGATGISGFEGTATFGTGEIAAGQHELASGDYYVEVRLHEGSRQFRLVDDQGDAVSIRPTSGNGSFTGDWQNIPTEAAAYDTGRGLSIDFNDVVTGIPADRYWHPSTPDAARVRYAAQGAAIAITGVDTLQDIRDKINNTTFVPGNGVQASILNNQLVLSAGTPGYVLEGSGALLGPAGLDLGSDTNADGVIDWTHVMSSPVSAQVTIHTGSTTMTVQRRTNTGLDDIISGVTLNLQKTSTTPVTLTVAEDNNAVTGQAKAFAERFNSVMQYLTKKTAVTPNSDGKTYTRGSLAGDSIFNALRMNLIRDLSTPPEGLSSTAPASLRAIGISFDVSTLELRVDTSVLGSALTGNRRGVAELLDKAMDGLIDRLATFAGDGTASNGGVLTKLSEQLETQRTALNGRITGMEERLVAQEATLTRQYSLLLAQYANVQAEMSTFTSFSTLG